MKRKIYGGGRVEEGNLVFSQIVIKSETAVSIFPTRTHWQFVNSISPLKIKFNVIIISLNKTAIEKS